MRVLKVAGLALIIVMLAAMWQRRVWVTSAYTSEPEDINFESRGVDLSFEPATLASTSFALQQAPALSDVALPRFGSLPDDGEVAILGGEATLGGSVVGPDGPVPGATVVIERFVESQRSELRVQTDESGSWSVPRAYGGAYRIRAYLPNTFVSPPSEVLFVADGDTVALRTVLTGLTTSISLSVVGGASTYPNQDQTVAIVATTSKVDGEGRVVTVPVAGTPIFATVFGSGTLVSAATVTTDVGGAARFRIRCQSPGSISINGNTAGVAINSAVPACVSPPPPPPEPTVEDEDVAPPVVPAAPDEETP